MSWPDLVGEDEREVRAARFRRYLCRNPWFTVIQAAEQFNAQPRAAVWPWTEPAHNVVAMWLGIPAPIIPRQRNKSKAGHRKTTIRRPRENGVSP